MLMASCVHCSIKIPLNIFQKSISKDIKFQIFLWVPYRCPKEAHKTTQRASRRPFAASGPGQKVSKTPKERPKTFQRKSQDGAKITLEIDFSCNGRPDSIQAAISFFFVMGFESIGVDVGGLRIRCADDFTKLILISLLLQLEPVPLP